MKEDKQKLVFISILVLVVLVGVVLFLFNNKKGTGTINSVSDIKSMIKTIYKQVDLPELATSVIDVKNEDEVTAYTGLQSNKDVEALVISSPTMTSQAYLLSVVKVKDGANVEKMKQEMLDNIDMDIVFREKLENELELLLAEAAINGMDKRDFLSMCNEIYSKIKVSGDSEPKTT